MSRIIWRRVRSEWVGRLTAGEPDRFSVVRIHFDGRMVWEVADLHTGRVGTYDLLRHAKDAAEAMK